MRFYISKWKVHMWDWTKSWQKVQRVLLGHNHVYCHGWSVSMFALFLGSLSNGYRSKCHTFETSKKKELGSNHHISVWKMRKLQKYSHEIPSGNMLKLLDVAGSQFAKGGRLQCCHWRDSSDVVGRNNEKETLNMEPALLNLATRMETSRCELETRMNDANLVLKPPSRTSPVHRCVCSLVISWKRRCILMIDRWIESKGSLLFSSWMAISWFPASRCSNSSRLSSIKFVSWYSHQLQPDHPIDSPQKICVFSTAFFSSLNVHQPAHDDHPTSWPSQSQSQSKWLRWPWFQPSWPSSAAWKSCNPKHQLPHWLRELLPPVLSC